MVRVGGGQDTGEEAQPLNEWFLAKLRPFSENLAAIWRKYEAEMKEGWYLVVRQAALAALDTLWMEHLTTIEDLREGIGLRGYAGTDPVVIYKKEAHQLFRNLLDEIYAALAERLTKLHAEVEARERLEVVAPARRQLHYVHESVRPVAESPLAFHGGGGGGAEAAGVTYHRAAPKVGRNDPCPCGAKHPDGRPVKYKHCHGGGA
jgi:preprotein translocase subunit SecA